MKISTAVGILGSAQQILPAIPRCMFDPGSLHPGALFQIAALMLEQIWRVLSTSELVPLQVGSCRAPSILTQKDGVCF
jgi:hypothetical protein